ncbi:hypothetical protein, secreted [gut metagenome]|uniref:PrcB C-terminal domain-containing protein n=1 Tax=gut metagenome TaxID=749906 RepID=J9G8B3_9ZZZZ
MKKYLGRKMAGFFALCLFLTAGGCVEKRERTEKLRDIEFTVAEKQEIPEELKEMIAEQKEKGFQISYADQGKLYIASGYGTRPTSGYSIEVKELYETENAVYIQTELLGPSKEEKITEKQTYPYIVVKLEWIDKNIVFE